MLGLTSATDSSTKTARALGNIVADDPFRCEQAQNAARIDARAGNGCREMGLTEI